MNSLVNLSSGHDVPQLGLGTWKCERDQVKDAVSHALRNGYTHIDCAIVYENQEEVGQAISEVISSGTLQRGDLFVTSKLWITHLKPEHVEENLDETLGQLSLEYLDLFLIHWPFALKKRKNPIHCFLKKKMVNMKLNRLIFVKLGQNWKNSLMLGRSKLSEYLTLMRNKPPPS
mmetsp:Transcript_24765/g.41351  ORF Transcript_24765/g.41351 Transcript_24765/m.41351 type:complete len:174 (+) Transcript_24765:70-591(+)